MASVWYHPFQEQVGLFILARIGGVLCAWLEVDRFGGNLYTIDPCIAGWIYIGEFE